ncbi:acyl carrier protein [Pilimelia anulata]|nr:acyl carrier protein [Pilimelia anulata]
MATLTLDALRDFLLRSVGDDESIDVSGDIRDTGLADLGFDSLAVIDTVSRVERHFGIKLPESATADVTTPGDILAVVNAHLPA